MTENPINDDDQIIHLEEDKDEKSFNNEDKYIRIEYKTGTNEDKLRHIHERINAENFKAQQLLLNQPNLGNLNRIKNINNLGLENMDLSLDPKLGNIHDFNNNNFPLHLPNSKSQKNEIANSNKNNINFMDTFDNNNIIHNVMLHSHSNRSNRSNISNKSNHNVKNININITNSDSNNKNNINDINKANILSIRNKIEEQKEKEKIEDNALLDTNLLTNKLLENKTPEEIKALLSSTQNKEQLNDLIEVLIQDKDFMKEFLMVEKKNSNGNEIKKDNNIINVEEKKDEDKINNLNSLNNLNTTELIKDKNILSNKDFETIYKELNEDEKKIKKQQQQFNGNYVNDAEDDIVIDEEEEKKENDPFNKIYKLIRKNGINRVFNILIDIFNKSETNYKFLEEEEIKDEITEITKTIRKDVLFIYLMKIICNNTTPPLFPSPNLQMPPKNNNLNSNSDLTPFPLPSSLPKNDFYTNVTKYEKTVIVTKKKGGQVPVDFQYHSRHFHWKHGKLYSYAPKNKMKASKCFLYCGKNGCEAKVQIDMTKKKAIFIGSHNEHEGINIEKYAYEYPGLDTKDWKHIQYDCLNGKKILMWKY